MDRQRDESDKAWLAWECYRDLGPARTVMAAWREYARATNLDSTMPSSGFKSWPKKYDWESRARKWDQANQSASHVLSIGVLDDNETTLMEVAHKHAKGEIALDSNQTKTLNRLIDLYEKRGTLRAEDAPEETPEKFDAKSALQLLRSK